MLKKLKQYFFFHLQAATDSFSELGQSFLSTFLTTLTFAFTLVIPALFWLFSAKLHFLNAQWQNQGHILLYLQQNLSPEKTTALLSKLRSLPEVKALHLKTAEDNLRILERQAGMKEAIQHLPNNPLPALIELVPNTSLKTPEDFQHFLEQFKAYPEINASYLDLSWLKGFYVIMKWFERLWQGLAIIIAFGLIFVISNTLRLLIQHKKESIQILKLVGATNSFIARPFLYTGIWYGALGALLAMLFIELFIYALAPLGRHIEIILSFHDSGLSLSLKQAYQLLAFSVLIGWLGAQISLRNQLLRLEPPC